MTIAERVVAWLAGQDLEAYLVGGFVRDRLLGRSLCDLDVAVAGDGLAVARAVANRFGGAYFPLDDARATGRAILSGENRERLIVDVARLRGPDLAADLADRDFTVNALAASVRSPADLIDNHGGLADLAARTLRPVGDASIRNDPVRALRAVRLAAELSFALSEEAQALIRRDGAGLAGVSGERIRDELARMLALPDAGAEVHRLDDLGLLTVVFPELEPLRSLAQPAPHEHDALAHSLETVHCLDSLLSSLRAGPRPAPDPLAPLAPLAGRIQAHLGQAVAEARPRLVTLKLAALLHDLGKPGTRTVDEAGRIRFLGHPEGGAETTAAIMRRLRFNNAEVRLAETIVRHHMRPLLLAEQDGVSARAVYRFFRATGAGGVEVVLHALADLGATYAAEGQGDRRAGLVAVAARLLGDYWERRAERVAPAPLLDGDDLLREFGLEPGRKIGELLEAVREAQVSGEVASREEALALVDSRLRALGGEPGSGLPDPQRPD